MHDHLKPKDIGWDGSLETVTKFQEQFQVWISEVSRMSGEDKSVTWNSLMALLNSEWKWRSKEDPILKEKALDQTFERMSQILLVKW